MVRLNVGLDDTDSRQGNCTTYIAAVLIERLARLNVSFTDYPNLIRLNPNIPWKTRGNAAVALRAEVEESILEPTIRLIVETVEDLSDLQAQGTDTAIVLHQGEIPEDYVNFSRRAMWDLIPVADARREIRRHCTEALTYNSQKGLVGALAAIGNRLEDDHTYEYVAYREKRFWGTERKIDADSVLNMDLRTQQFTFNNVDPETHRILITPRGPDPVLFGVRGESPDAVERAARMISVGEPIERWVIFRTNQGTDAHFSNKSLIGNIKPFQSVVVEGRVSSKPKTQIGGHVFFTIEDHTGRIECAAYEQTGSFRENVRKLMPGDLVIVYGGVRKASKSFPRAINVEKIEILELVEDVARSNPLCPVCSKRLKSMGRAQGLRCEHCGYKTRDRTKQEVKLQRSIDKGLYMPPPRAHRHLTKPLKRYGREISQARIKLIETWHQP